MAKQIVGAAPSGAGITFEDFLGKLFVVEPLEVEKGVKTIHGESDAVRANVYVLLGPDKVEEFEDTLIFPKVLQSQTRRKIGSYVVGRLGQGEAKRGQNAPWVFEAPSDGDLSKASKFLLSQGAAEEPEDDDAEAF